MDNTNKKRRSQLGMPQGTAANILKKEILFSLLKELKKNFCFQCNSEIKSPQELSIEHKIPYLDSENPIELYFSLDNIAFSHLRCNIKAARLGVKTKDIKELKHGAYHAYTRRKCRCSLCLEWKSNKNKVTHSNL